MFWNAKEGRVRMDGAVMDYISFGTGRSALVMLPGLSDGLASVRGTAWLMALAYRLYAPHYRVYLFSRRELLPPGFSTRDMARDQAEALRRLGIGRASVLGVSQGGMIAQYLAIDSPALVEKLVLAVTLARPNATEQAVLTHWRALARQGDYAALLCDTAEKSYSEKYLKKYRPFYPLLGRFSRPPDFGRFLVQADACLGHDAYAQLGRIACPTLVIGGAEDQIVGAAASAELAGRIPNSTLYLCPGLGHGAYEEDSTFNRRVLDFLLAPAEGPQNPPA